MLNINRAIYHIPDDRLYSVEDLLYNHQKFIRLYLNELENETLNIMVALAWLLALINRYHINIEDLMWRRYSFKCPFCLDIPCSCTEGVKNAAHKTGRPSSRQPESIGEWQNMVLKIYPSDKKETLELNLVNASDRLNSSFRLFMREKKNKQFKDIETGLTDYTVILIRLFNVNNISIDQQFEILFYDGCYVCHQIPCECNYFE